MEDKSENKISNDGNSGCRKGCFWWGAGIMALIVFIGGGLVIIFLILSIMSSLGLGGSFDDISPAYAKIKEEFVSGDYRAENKIAVIDISGVIVDAAPGWGDNYANASLICQMISKASADPHVVAVILKLDTPGGEVTASDIIYHEIMKLRKKTGKPVISSMGSVAASGGVYVAVASDYIIANNMTTTGSIGVIAQAYNYSELLNKIGIDAEIYKSGKMKDILNGARKRTEPEKIIIKEFISEVYDEFVSNVAERRNLNLDEIKNSPMCDGRFYSGRKALQYGLIDEIGYFEDAVIQAADMAKVSKYKVVLYQKNLGLANILFGMYKKPEKLKVELPGTNSTRMELPSSGKFFMLPPEW